MDQVEALRTAARRFCIDQHARWGDEYLRLESNGGSRVNLGGIRWEYSSEAYSLFPRYRLDEAIQIEIEKLTGYRFQSVEQARQQFIDTARTELSRLCSEFHEKPEAIRALQSEMQAFESFVAQLQAAHLETVAPLPYRRVFGDTESKGLWEKLQAGWNAPSAGHY